MKKILFITSTVLVYAVLNYGIYQKEHIKKKGDTVLLELAPFHYPFSIYDRINYMDLDYVIERTWKKATNQTDCTYQGKKMAPDKQVVCAVTNNLAMGKRGHIVVGVDKNKIGTFKGFYSGKKLAANEQRLPYHNQNGQLRIVPHTFVFLAGQGKAYKHAKYGVFKVDGAGNAILVGLADQHLHTIQPKT